ncbi:cytochrome P450 [Actinoplanes awajinensis]|uniref:cytochrome P450 n=1 Tax=Actinoplanes awajinensis TaxID=135946 RepID=UPI000A054DF9|nr:cytochrome P450 [Actinoplanes awajinensis]
MHPVDLSDAALYQHGDPLPVWARLRAQSPVHDNRRADGERFWAVMTHPLCSEMLTNPKVFSSANGMRLDSNKHVLARAAGKMLNVTDPPRHDKIRKVISSAFTPSTVRRLEATMRATAGRAIAAALSDGGCEFTRVAHQLPVSVICDLLGVPEADWDFMADRTRFAWSSTASDEKEEAEKVQAHTEIMGYFLDLAADRRKSPGDDLVSALVHGTVDGKVLTDEEVLYNCDALLSGGNETTRHATVGGLLALMTDPAAWADLRQDRSLLPSAIQEIVRYTSPVMHSLRTATRDVELGGVPIRAGEHVVAWLPSANRDEQVFEAPGRFDVRRSPNRHLGFIQGNHYCVGASLAAMELTVMFDELLDRVAEARPAGPVRRLRSNLLWGFDALPVSFVAADAGTPGARRSPAAAGAAPGDGSRHGCPHASR